MMVYRLGEKCFFNEILALCLNCENQSEHHLTVYKENFLKGVTSRQMFIHVVFFSEEHFKHSVIFNLFLPDLSFGKYVRRSRLICLTQQHRTCPAVLRFLFKYILFVFFIRIKKFLTVDPRKVYKDDLFRFLLA